MKLTRRQEDFIRKLLDLYQEAKEPLHYTELAERLGVSPFTAYDMLRLLEEKGLATSEFRLSGERSGPGRSERVFAPTPKAHALVANLAGGWMGVSESWESTKEFVLERIRSGEIPEVELAEELLAHIPAEDQDPLSYCLEVMTTLVLRLRKGAGRQLLLEYLPILLPQVDTDNMEDLGLLGGFALGVLASENVDDPVWCRELFQHVRRYESFIVEMPSEQRRQLVESLREVLGSLTQVDSEISVDEEIDINIEQ